MSSETADFSKLGLISPLLRAIVDTGYTTPTPIQTQAIPLVLDGGDLLAAAQTGTGKTAGFTLPLLQRLAESAETKPRPGVPRCLVLTPTRELAIQIEASVQTYSKYTDACSEVVFGGVNINRNINALKKPVDILIATPGRLLDLVGQKYMDLSQIEIMVFDEADRMLDMGFIHDVKRILKLLPKQRQTLLFSATFSKEIRTLAKTMLINPREVSVARRNTASELVDQSVYLVDKTRKRALLSQLIKQHQWPQVLVFTKTKHGANRLATQLEKDGISAGAIHGNKSQAARVRALESFKSGSLQVLVATDIAARGLDIKMLPNVVNYELPHVAEDYVHRIGRTGRAGSAGTAVSLVDADELKLLSAIERLINRDVNVIEIEGVTGHQVPAGAANDSARNQRHGQPSRNKKAHSNSGNGGGRNGNSRRGGANRKKTSGKGSSSGLAARNSGNNRRRRSNSG